MTRKIEDIQKSITEKERPLVDEIQARLKSREGTKTEIYNRLRKEYPLRLIYAAAGVTSIPWQKNNLIEADNEYTTYLSDLKQVMDRLPLEEAERAAVILFRAYQTDHTVFLFGNGGSAALASHMAADLGKCTHFPGPEWLAPVKRLKALAVSDNTPMITAWANDTAYENVFAGQMENFLQAGDVAFGISGSGNSPNVLRALELARRKGATTVGLAGCGGGKMKALLDCVILVPSDNMQRVEDAHLILAHMIFLDLKRRIESEARQHAEPTA